MNFIKEAKTDIRSDGSFLYMFALISHCLMFIIFFLNKITIMTFFNIGSITLYIVLLVVLKKNGSVSIRTFCTTASALEVVIHQVLAIICVGNEVGFQYFLLIVAVTVIMQSDEIVSKRTKSFLSVLIMIIVIVMGIYSLRYQPLYPLNDYVKLLILIPITAVSVFGVFSACSKQWNISEHYRRQTEELLEERDTKIFYMQEKIIHNFADIVETRDGNTGGHVKRTSAYVEAIMDALMKSGRYPETLTEKYRKMVVSAAPLHDIGKIAISDSILCKKGKLTDEEFTVMKTHSTIGGNMLKGLLGDLESEEYVSLAVEISRNHHEKWNGKGYPDGLAGETIPVSARVMAVADVFDALTSVRVYKDKLSLDDAYKIMESEAGQHFDPVIISEFIRIKPQISEILSEPVQ